MQPHFLLRFLPNTIGRHGFFSRELRRVHGCATDTDKTLSSQADCRESLFAWMYSSFIIGSKESNQDSGLYSGFLVSYPIRSASFQIYSLTLGLRRDWPYFISGLQRLRAFNGLKPFPPTVATGFSVFNGLFIEPTLWFCFQNQIFTESGFRIFTWVIQRFLLLLGLGPWGTARFMSLEQAFQYSKWVKSGLRQVFASNSTRPLIIDPLLPKSSQKRSTFPWILSEISSRAYAGWAIGQLDFRLSIYSKILAFTELKIFEPLSQARYMKQ